MPAEIAYFVKFLEETGKKRRDSLVKRPRLIITKGDARLPARKTRSGGNEKVGQK